MNRIYFNTMARKAILLPALALLVALAGPVNALQNAAVDASLLAALQPHDDFDNALIIASLPYRLTVTDFEATPVYGNPLVDPPSTLCGLKEGLETVWYTYTPPATIKVRMDTIGSSYDTYLAVWTGTSGNLTEVACNDDANANTFASAIYLTLQAGTQYYIEVAQHNGTLDADTPPAKSLEDAASEAAVGKTHVFRLVPMKTSVFRSLSATDGYILETAENSNKGGLKNNTASTLRIGDDAARKQYRSILSFRTSALPDGAVITRVLLKVKRQGVTGGGDPINIFQGFYVDLRKGTFGSAALWSSDWEAAANKTLGPFKPAITSGWYKINLTAGRAQINKLATSNGLTQIRLRFKLDDNNNAVANYLSLYSGDAPTAARPQLVITYYVP